MATTKESKAGTEPTIPSNDKSTPTQSNITWPSKPTGFAIAIGVGVLLLAGGSAAGFVAGKALDKPDEVGRGMQQGGQQRVADAQAGGGMSGGGSMRGMFGGVSGQVTAVSSSSITLQDQRSGGSVTFAVDGETTVNNNQGEGAVIADVKVGDNVAVTGTTADGDTLASSIVIDPTVPTSRR